MNIKAVYNESSFSHSSIFLVKIQVYQLYTIIVIPDGVQLSFDTCESM